ncbi:helix-turn-helix transcriptional regulator [Sphingobacterium alkalisoli]|uniref:Helix-turn-helix transcriptional regulator n=1 Tax=Sphingobacterium alkalisoli TaxID=1874115 RepID=A0A4U0H211_9SPHI|nr:helix-turn-helix transcriptional regulator [Sphingobacterium alkalisoli]TJY65496.1 helix-turn-helix transcriptional regulator [Sphingobacterium alkalisoli]GGH20112.1 AraC family transcriptional regulator [Sphingobacterium alkalisoli]
MENTFRFHSLTEFHTFCGLPKPEHPLISLIDYSKVNYPLNDIELKWIQHFYSIGLKRNVNARFNYGQQQYDFDSGVLCFVSPDQFLRLEVNPEAQVEPTGWLLLIHPDFLWHTDLATKINGYEFFKYAVNEALFLSDKEEQTVVDILQNIEKEYQSNVDKFSQDLIIKQVERLLIYAERFYERQFITRKKSTQELVVRFEQLLSQHFTTEKLCEHGIPTVTTIAAQLNISANYLGSLLRIYTQQNTQQHIQNKVIDYAKTRLSTTALSVSEIAYELGFEHSQSFSKMFKAKTSQSPLEFREAFN